MSSSKTDTGGWRAEQRDNTRRLAAWTAAWLLTMAIAVFGSTLLWPDSDVIKLVSVLTNVAVGFGMIIANKRHLDGLDELHRRIQLEAMAFTLGAGLVLGFGYTTLDITNLIESDAKISLLLVVMSLTYLGSVIFGVRKYA